MNTIKKLQNAFFAAMALFSINSCVNDDDWSLPPVECNNAWTTNLTMDELFAMADAANGEILSFTEEKILEGYVVSSDSTGNFFKTLSIQNKLENPTRGLQVEMDRSNLYTNFPLGAKIQINLIGLNVAYDRGMLKIGETYEDNNGNIRVGRMMDAKINGRVKKTCEEIKFAKPVVYENIKEVMDKGVFNTLVTIKNVQFDNAELGKVYAETNQTVDRILTDDKNNKIKLRNSGYASFADEILPEGSGSITVVLNGYDQNVDGTLSPSEYQLYIRSTKDVQFDNPRFGDTPPSGDTNFVACLNETFNDYTVNNESFSNYENLAIAGTRKWRIKEHGGNKYIEASAFQTTGAVVTYFTVPVNFSKADAMSFKTKDGHNNGNVLKVYYSTNYVPGGNINNATLVDITNNFTIASGTTNGYANDFTESGTYTFNQLTGNGVIIFAYEGNGPDLSTTMQIDDIRIYDNEDPNCSSGNGGGSGEDPTPPSDEAAKLFAGSDFENWNDFLSSINNFGLKPYATQGIGLGQNGSHSLHIEGTPTGNDYVFTSYAASGLPSTYSKVTFFMKGTSAKSVSVNLYYTDSDYYKFNLGTITSSSVIQQAENNQYTGSINTNGEWVQITLDLTGITDLNVGNTNGNIFALKVGRDAEYHLDFDNFVIE